MTIVTNLYKISDFLFGKRLSEKLKMAANVLFHEWHMYQGGGDFMEEFRNVSDEEIISAFRELDPGSVEHILRFVAFQRDIKVPDRTMKYYFYNYTALYRPEELRQRKRQETELKKELRKYRSFNNMRLGSFESLVEHHGLKDLPPAVREYLRDGIFLDVGACLGDSALVFLKHYQPAKVFSFEPSGPNREIYLKNMQGNGIPSSRYEVIPAGVGKACSTLTYNETSGGGNSLLAEAGQEGRTVQVDITTCDDFCSERKISGIRLIKADIEGMGLDMLLGAEKVIRADRPVLSLSIYHNRDELFGIYRTLKSWDLEYSFRVRMLAFPADFGELTLLAWPEELTR